jgi:hypothetical protein
LFDLDLIYKTPRQHKNTDKRRFIELFSPTAAFTYQVSQKKNRKIIIAIDFKDKDKGIGQASDPEYIDLYIWGLPAIKTK